MEGLQGVASRRLPPTRRVLLWFRRDLRLADNPALVAALSMGEVIPVYIWAPEEEGQFQPGRCSRWWLHHSLVALDADLRALGSRLLCFRASDSHASLTQLAQQLGAAAVVFNHLYDPISMVRDNEVKAGLATAGIFCQSFNADILREPWEMLDARGKPFTSYDAFWTAHCALPYPPVPPLARPPVLPPLAPGLEEAATAAGEVGLKALGIMSKEEEMSNAQLDYHWKPGCAGAHKLFEDFVRSGRLQAFDRDRAKTDRASTSQLSPHIHYGEISVRHIHYVARHQQMEWARSDEGGTSVEDFLRQLGYREYSRYLSFHFPFTHERSLLEHLRAVPWRFDQRLFKAWRQGRTGYPLVDAAMREVWSTGWMHNRMRVVAASFMVKNLLLPWQWGLKHYWDALLDADLECDALGWQYVSGCMADAHEFSDTIDHHQEAKRFDPDGNYVRRWLPVLARLPAQYIHEPWTAPEGILSVAGVELGVNYPFPVISVEESAAALAAANAVVQECLRSSGTSNVPAAGAAAPAALKSAVPQGPFRPATDADPAEAERMFAEHYRNNVLCSDAPPAQPAVSAGSEDVQSNCTADTAAGGLEVAVHAAAAAEASDDLLSSDLLSCAPPIGDAGRSYWCNSGATTASGSAAPSLPEQLPDRMRATAALPEKRAAAAWHQPLTACTPGGSGGNGSGGNGSGGGTGHATGTGVSLGLVPSLSGGAAGTASVPQADAAGAMPAPARRPCGSVRRPSPQEDLQQQQQAQQQQGPGATHEGQHVVCCAGDKSAPSAERSSTVQQPMARAKGRSLREVGMARAGSRTARHHDQQEQQSQLQPQPNAHKRQRARSPPPAGNT